MEWNGKATAIRNAEGELTTYAGAWVHADAEDQTSAVEPVARPGGCPPTGKVWNGKAHTTMNTEGMITAYTGEYVEPRPDDVSSDNSGDDLEQQSSAVGQKKPAVERILKRKKLAVERILSGSYSHDIPLVV